MSRVLQDELEHFYPRPPRGGRPAGTRNPRCAATFLSTSSARRTTPDTDGDGFPDQYFYPRPPRGGRQICAHGKCCHFIFLSTSSARRTTFCEIYRGEGYYISIHVLREEDDAVRSAVAVDTGISIHVLREEDDIFSAFFILFLDISIHVLREEDDATCTSTDTVPIKFLSTSSARRTTRRACPF